jgi:hypothetical protein
MLRKGSRLRCAENESAGAAGARPSVSVNACSNVAELRERAAQKLARAAGPRRAVQLDEVGQNETKRRTADDILDARVRRHVGLQTQIADSAQGVRGDDGVERIERHVRRHPADALDLPCPGIVGRHAAAPGHAHEVGRQ